MNNRKAGVVIGAVTALAALLAGVAALRGGDGSSSSGDVTNNGDSNQNYCQHVKGACNITVVPAPAELGDDDAAVAAKIRRDGPWSQPGARPFMVLRDVENGDPLGVYVRTTPDAAGKRLGIIQHHDIAWVDCVKITDFDPDPATGNGPRWYRVHYTEVANGPLESNPQDSKLGWSYAYYLSPSGHNGELPTCT